MNQPDGDEIELATRLFSFARTGAAAKLAAYVDAGIPVDLRNDSGDTLLMLAAYHGHLDTVAALLARQADPNIANDRGQTPLAAAVFKDEPGIVAMLERAGADPDAGHPSARATAEMFDRKDLARLLG